VSKRNCKTDTPVSQEKIKELIARLAFSPLQMDQMARSAYAETGKKQAQALFVERMLLQQQECAQVVRELAAIGKPAVPHLLDALRTADDVQQIHLLNALGEIGDPAALEPMLALLVSPTPASLQVPLALGKMGDPHAVVPLIERLERAEEHIRSLPTEPDTLPRIGWFTRLVLNLGMRFLMRWPLQNMNPKQRHETRRAAYCLALLTALKHLNDPRAIPAIEKRLADPNAGVRIAAQDALEHLRGKK
jgi:HEAT repeat protein